MGFFSRHRKAFRSVIASFGMLFGLLAGVSVTANVAYAGISGSLNDSLTSLLTVTATKDGEWSMNDREMTGTVTGSKTLWWDNEESVKKQSYYFSTLCGYSPNLHKPYAEYLNELETKKSGIDIFDGVGKDIDSQEIVSNKTVYSKNKNKNDDIDFSWLDEIT